jgi:putative transposase
MFEDFEIERLFVEFGLPEEGRELVRFARKHSPVREANSNLGNCIVWHFSRKMGNRHLELESRTVEAPAATLYEDDPACLEFWPQPFRIDLRPKNEDGVPTGRGQHTPDFLLIRRDGIYVHEWREESRLIRLAKESPQFFKREGRWHYRAAEDYFSRVGLNYELHSAMEIPRTFVVNIHFLKDYQLPTCPPLPEEVESKLLNLLSERGSISFLDLSQQHNIMADDIFRAIVKKSVTVDLYKNRLDVPSGLMVHTDMAIARAYSVLSNNNTPALPLPGVARISAGARIRFDSRDFEVLLVGGGQVLLRDSEGNRNPLPIDDVVAMIVKSDIDVLNAANSEPPLSRTLADYSHEQLETGINRLTMITEGSTVVSDRTLQRWRAKTDGALSDIDKIIALVGNDRDKGNRNARLPEKVESVAEEAIRKYFNTEECRTALAVYNKYQTMCEEHELEPMSYPTFTKRVNDKGSTKKREGKRKAYQETAIPLLLDYGSPIHGAFPHDVCYVDHTILNLATVGPEGTELGKPTFTLATDGHTTQARACYLSYDPPSAKVVLMLLRDYVRRNNRLPRILVVDGGKEFRSQELAWFCRLYGIDLRHRPAGMPRGGSIVERAMGATETEVIAQMEGNTRIMKNVRMVTKSVNPFPNAVWTLTAAHGALDEYLFEIRDNRLHPTLGLTPRAYEEMRMRETGLREHTIVKFDQNLLLLTSPHAKRKFHTIDRKRGVWADNMYYWHDDFSSAKSREKFEVRVEQWNANVVYVYFRDRWVAAIARDLRAFGDRTRSEVEIAIRTERRLAKTNSNKDRIGKINAKKMVGLWSPEKFDERIGKQQREMKYLYERLGMTVAMQVNFSTTVIDVAVGPDALVTNMAVDVIADNVVSLTNRTTQNEDSNFWRGINAFV